MKNTDNFEEAMKRLEEIASELESGKFNLDESVDKFEEGMNLSKKCNDILEKAEKRISILINSEDGIKEEKFIPDEE